MISRATFATSRTFRVIAAFAALGLVSLIALALVGGSKAALGLGVALVFAPILVALALRYPIFFPFGVYLAFVPFDPLLSVTGGGGTLTKFAGIAAIAAILARTIALRKVLMPPRIWFAWFFFLVFASATLGWSIDFEHSLELLNVMFSLFALFTVLALYPIRYFELLWMRRSLIVIGVVTAAYGFYQNEISHHSMAIQHDRLMISSGKLRFDPNHYAAFFMIPIAIVTVGFLYDRRPLWRLAYVSIFAACVGNVLLTSSRGALIGVIIVVLYLGLRTRRYVATGSIVASGIFMSFFIPNVWARFTDPTQGEGSGRNEIWSTGLHALHQYWFVGSGFGTYPDVYEQYLLQTPMRVFQGHYRPSHSIIFESIVEFGLVGSLLLAFALWTTIRTNVTIARAHPLFTYRLEAEGMFVGVFWMALTIDVLWYKYFWLTLAFALLVANVHRGLGSATVERVRATPRPSFGRPMGRVVRRSAPP